MTMSGSKKWMALGMATLVALPALALAVETDRLTVEDPSSGAVMFRVTSSGNVTGAAFAGDGAALANVAHFKGAWINTTAYAKDDCVTFGGSSYIALAASTGINPTTDAAKWQVMAAKGSDGAPGANGAPGATGPQGIQGPAGPAGSPDTQAAILTKISAQADGAALIMQQSGNDSATTVKLAVKDAANVNKFGVTASGSVAIGTATPDSSLHVKAQPAVAGTGTISVSNNGNTVTGVGTAFTSQLHVGDAITAAGQTQNVATIVSDTSLTAGAIFTPAISGATFTYSPKQIVKLSDTTGSDKFVVTAGGNVGIGTSGPGHSLDVYSTSGPVAQFINTVGGTSGAGFVNTL